MLRKLFQSQSLLIGTAAVIGIVALGGIGYYIYFDQTGNKEVHEKSEQYEEVEETLSEYLTEPEEDEEPDTVEEPEKQEVLDENDVPEGEAQPEVYDLRDYSDVLTEDLGGNLAETLANLLYPEDPYFSESDDGMMYVLGNYDMEVGASANNDGYMVWMYHPVEKFRIYGIEPGMTEADAETILAEQGITKSESGYYMVSEPSGVFGGYKYINLSIEDGTVNQVNFMHYLGSGSAVDDDM